MRRLGVRDIGSGSGSGRGSGSGILTLKETRAPCTTEYGSSRISILLLMESVNCCMQCSLSTCSVLASPRCKPASHPSYVCRPCDRPTRQAHTACLWRVRPVAHPLAIEAISGTQGTRLLNWRARRPDACIIAREQYNTNAHCAHHKRRGGPHRPHTAASAPAERPSRTRSRLPQSCNSITHPPRPTQRAHAHASRALQPPRR